VLKLSRVEILRESVKQVIAMLTNAKVAVTQVGTDAYVRYNRWGKAELVNLPALPDDASEELIDATQGFLDHECAHILFTDSEWLAKAAGTPMQQLHNVLEDIFIEKAMRRAYKGSARNLSTTWGFLQSKLLGPKYELMKDTASVEKLQGLLGAAQFRAWSGCPLAGAFMADKDHLFTPMRKVLGEELIDQIGKTESTEQTYKLSVAIFNRLQEYQERQEKEKRERERKEKEEKEEKERKEKEESESGGCEDAEDEGESQSGAAQGNPHPDDDNEGGESEPEEDDSGDGDGDEAEEGDDGDEDADGDDSDGKDEESGDEGEDEDEESGAGGEDDEDEGEDAEKGDEEDAPGEGGEDGEGDDGEEDANDEDEGADDGEDEDAAAVEDDGEEDEDEDEGEDDEGSVTGGEDENEDGDKEDEDDSDGASGGEDEAEGSGEEGDGGEKGEDDIGDDPEAIGEEHGAGGEDVAGAIKALEELNDTSKDLSEQIAAMTRSAVNGGSYYPLTRDDDRIEKLATEPHHENDRWVQAMVDATNAMAGPLQRGLERTIAARSHARKVPGFRSGKIHSASLHRLRVANDRVFRRKFETQTKDVAVQLVVDLSGSMGGVKLQTAMNAAYAMSSVLDRMNIKNEVIGFTTISDTELLREHAIKAREFYDKNGKYPDRWDVIYMPIIKDFNERLTTERRLAFAQVPHTVTTWANIDGESILYANRRLASRTETRKIMIVLSDGLPAGGGDEDRLAAHLREAVQRIMQSGTDVFGIGIMDASVSKFYPMYAVLQRLADLPQTVLGTMEKMLFKG
jgi:cobalamin biosynthesis protein CobT